MSHKKLPYIINDKKIIAKPTTDYLIDIFCISANFFELKVLSVYSTVILNGFVLSFDAIAFPNSNSCCILSSSNLKLSLFGEDVCITHGLESNAGELFVSHLVSLYPSSSVGKINSLCLPSNKTNPVLHRFHYTHSV